jgi:hypothetical protein
MTIEPPRLALLEVATEPYYVIGFPVYAALTIAPEPRDATLVRIPVAGWEGTRGAVGVRLIAPGDPTKAVASGDALPVADRDIVPVVRLSAGERRRMLVDLGEALPDLPPPGEYEAVVSFGPEAVRATAAPVRLSFRAPDDRERQVLATLDTERGARGTWGSWTRLPPLEADHFRDPWGPDDPLRFNWIVRDLFYGPLPLASYPLENLDVLDGLLVPEREALRAELLHERPDQAAFAAQVASVKHNYPSLTYWMNQLLNGESDLAWARRARVQ